MPRTARANTMAPNPDQAAALATLEKTVARLSAQADTHLKEANEQRARADAAERELLAGSTTPGGMAYAAKFTGVIESGDAVLGGDGDDAIMPPTGPARIVQRVIETPEGPYVDKKWGDNMQFMEEKVTVIVHQQGESRYPEPAISVWNGGTHQLFPRDHEVTCARKFLEVLARAKVATYGNQEYINEEGIRAQKYPKRVAHKYPFSVIRDDNPRGRAWLARIFQEA